MSDDKADIKKNVADLRKAAKCVFLAVDEVVAQDLADKLNGAAALIEELQAFAIWMTGCGYDFCQHDYFCKKRDKLLIGNIGAGENSLQ